LVGPLSFHLCHAAAAAAAAAAALAALLTIPLPFRHPHCRSPLSLSLTLASLLKQPQAVYTLDAVRRRRHAVTLSH
jgi:hypothetical protein